MKIELANLKRNLTRPTATFSYFHYNYYPQLVIADFRPPFKKRTGSYEFSVVIVNATQ